MNPFDSLYHTDRLRAAFGEHFCGPEHLPHAEETLVADLPKDPHDGDGESVKVYASAWPALFLTLHTGGEPNSVGKAAPPFTITFGSGQERLAAEIAQAVSTGMLSARPKLPMEEAR